MQIHEIARRNINEGPLKGVATNIAKGAVNTVKPVVNYAVDQAKGVAKAPLNTAEYFANKILDTAGVPAAQQGQYSKYGHMAAGQNKGTASIAKAENEIATEIAKEWARLGTLNGQKVELPLDPKQIALAASKLNTGKLQLNTNNIVANVQKMAPEQRSLLDLYKKNPAAIPAEQPADTATNPTAGNNAFGQMATQLTTPAPAPVPNPAPAPVPNPAPAPVPKPAPPPSNNPFGQMATQLGKKSELEPVAESLTWSKNFDPSRQLYRRMKQGQTQ